MKSEKAPRYVLIVYFSLTHNKKKNSETKINMYKGFVKL